MFGAPQPLVSGQAAPPFTLPAQDGRSVNLVDFRGKKRVIVAFFPEDDARTARVFEDHLKRLAALQVQVLGVSPGSTASVARLVAKSGVGFPVLSDPQGVVARQYGARGLLPMFSGKTFVVDGRGLFQMRVDGPPDVERIVTFLDGLRGDL